MADLVVYFKRPNFWRESVNIYYWNTQPKSSSVEWPGVAMTEEGDNWYSYRFSGIEEASFCLMMVIEDKPETFGGIKMGGLCRIAGTIATLTQKQLL
ncbi:starch-binding protein [Crocosphaera watsonii]|uniref:Alpha amylase, catalytic region n=1 Tax=Crocosphaera watsonii WH 0003 TaxID=423471 RepID=G5J1B8_CROWT|nr:starch-binding protein [Crocosphaera watsonii]EHJ14019.1 Alpha amylase, catalytic region [Crocosphaera watsonii WH 0003]